MMQRRNRHGDVVASARRSAGAIGVRGSGILLRPKAILETVLYVDDLDRTSAFYERVLNLEPVHADDRMRVLRVSAQNFLLIFQTGATRDPIEVPGGRIPPHDGTCGMHVAFAVARRDRAAWLNRLQAHGIAVEGVVNWPSGASSYYFRDPAGNLVELATPDLWTNLQEVAEPAYGGRDAS